MMGFVVLTNKAFLVTTRYIDSRYDNSILPFLPVDSFALVITATKRVLLLVLLSCLLGKFYFFNLYLITFGQFINITYNLWT